MTGWWAWLPECRRCGVQWGEHGDPRHGYCCVAYRPRLRGWLPVLAYMTLTRAADRCEGAASWVAKRWLES